jgi:hypothetical protein
MRMAVRMRKVEMILMMTTGEVIDDSSPIFCANSFEVNLRRMRLPITAPKGCAMDWIRLAFSGDRVYLIDRLSREMSWMVRNSSVAMSSNAIADA